jgi:hypothetical protein
MEGQAIQTERSQGTSMAERARAAAAAIIEVAAPCFRWTGLDYLDPAYRAGKSAADKAQTDADLQGARGQGF